jgi:uncharacterized phage protein (TIGR01671 family)
MRQFKFRAWSPETKRLFPVECLSWEDGKIVTCEGFSQKYGVCTIWNDEPLELMQYTGVPDKDGVEIWEGDIISYNGDIGIVDFFAGNFNCNWNDQTDDPIGLMLTDKMTVIGNIWENPELLKTS